tara:strand:+ start:6858 stop:7760 length:903 start_codon:yes stop_codon:yes gene_type:complete
MSLCRYAVCLSLTLATSATQVAVAAPITFNTALPVGKGEFINREQLVLTRSGDDPSGADRDVDVNALASVLGYGISGDLAIFGVLPIVDKELQATVAGERISRSSTGIGDLSVFARYTFVQQDARDHTFRIAAFGGVKAPTGDDDESDALGRLPIPLQSGTGSWDGFGGVVATYQTLQFQIDAQASYTARSEANDFEGGDQARLDASFQYRLLPRTLGKGTPGFLYGVLEANVIHSDKNRVFGSAEPNSGGTSVFVVPGLQYVTKRYILEGSLQLPVSQDLNGMALENDYVARVGFRWNF